MKIIKEKIKGLLRCFVLMLIALSPTFAQQIQTGDTPKPGLLPKQTESHSLRVKLSMMDEKTAKELFGGGAAKDYYIVAVRFINDMRENHGASILVYAESMQIGVKMEKRQDDGGNKNPWREVNVSEDIYEAPVDSRCGNSVAFRPLTFAAVMGTESFFYSAKADKKRNILSMVLKPVEEIPFGTDLTRIFFVPKRQIKGILPKSVVRVSEICPEYYDVKFAIVEKFERAVP